MVFFPRTFWEFFPLSRIFKKIINIIYLGLSHLTDSVNDCVEYLSHSIWHLNFLNSTPFSSIIYHYSFDLLISSLLWPKRMFNLSFSLCLCAHMNGKAREGHWRLSPFHSNTFYLNLLRFSLFLRVWVWDRSSHWIWSWLLQLVWLDKEPLATPCLCRHRPWIAGACQHAWYPLQTHDPPRGDWVRTPL